MRHPAWDFITLNCGSVAREAVGLGWPDACAETTGGIGLATSGPSKKAPHDTTTHHKSRQDRKALLFAMNLSLGVGIFMVLLGIGTVLTLLAILINGALGSHLIKLGKKQNSNILVANGHHTFTDCWTGIAVLTGRGFVLATKWLPFDPI